jgi:hypothetical protein
MNFLRTLISTLVFALAAAASGSETPGVSPDKAMDALKAGHARYLSGRMVHPHQDQAQRSQTVAKGQHPFVTFISCADSRVPVETLFDQGIGDVFVVRVAGNVAGTDEIGTVEYGGGHDHGATGMYVVVDQDLWREHPEDETDDQRIGLFLQYGYANPAVSLVGHHIGAGLIWTEATPTRDDDQMGLGVSWVQFTDSPGAELSGHEWVVEVYYRIRVSKWLSVKPDIQYVADPGGAGGPADAMTFTLQVVADFWLSSERTPMHASP